MTRGVGAAIGRPQTLRGDLMKNHVMRGSTLGLVVLARLLSGIFISFSSFGLYIFTTEDTPLSVFVLCGILLVLLLIFGINLFCKEIYSYFTKVIINEEVITWTRPFRKKRTLPLAQISFWGGVSYAPRSTMIYFCAEEETKLIAYLQTHQKECLHIFGADRYNQMNNQDIGRLQLAVGTYIRQHLSGNENLFILRYGSIQRVKSLVNAMGRDAMITGPWLLDTADWDQATRQKTGNDSLS